ncbi:hypothetical protein GPECTOR_33g571 [Gonium pectorale]|uniref:Glycosyltransferase family 1 protein n=1 Tax=Gonium pectorale TaxID=33097 RepID=A0A150GCY1_GONPE|nr:hypothetical protein GPECTOR_33g571 [Gonium pectorale]|eukprot:KXZ47689.1 hypothetical protein GPECTOR_33g571 [Gonium pectorale]
MAVLLLPRGLDGATSVVDLEAALQRVAAGIQNWEDWSPELKSRDSCNSPGRSGPAPARVRYFTRHTGTLWDWMCVAEALQLNWDRQNPARFNGYGIGVAAADDVWRRNASALCGPDSDVLIHCDTVVDSRPALQNGCTKPIILQVTNRFDWKVHDRPAYIELMRTAAANERVFWVTNNPFEQLYMQGEGVTLPPSRHYMLRPLGAAVLPGRPLGEGAARRFAVISKTHWRRHPDRDLLLPQIKKLGLEKMVEVYENHYGGPETLVSVMSQYETLAAGGVLIVPSFPFFRTLRNRHHIGSSTLPLLTRAKREGLNATKYMEFYHPDFAPAMVYFTSWQHLGRIMRLPATDPMWEAKRAAGRRAMAAVRQATLEGWQALMAHVAAAACKGPTGSA